MEISWTVRACPVYNYDGVPFAVKDGLYIYVETDWGHEIITRVLYGPITNEIISQYEDQLHLHVSIDRQMDGQEE